MYGNFGKLNGGSGIKVEVEFVVEFFVESLLNCENVLKKISKSDNQIEKCYKIIFLR